MRATDHSEKKVHEKYRIYILGIAFLLIALLTVGFFTYRHYPNDEPINDIFSEGQLGYTRKTATEGIGESHEFATINIPQTKSLLFDPRNNILNQVAAGKIYYQGENGKLESCIITNRNRNEVCEELISYDNKGNEVDKLEIGYVCDSAKHLKCAVIFKNKISIYETKSNGEGKNVKIVTEYLISPQMKFSRGKTYTKL